MRWRRPIGLTLSTETSLRADAQRAATTQQGSSLSARHAQELLQTVLITPCFRFAEQTLKLIVSLGMPAQGNQNRNARFRDHVRAHGRNGIGP
jgi:hypothetical protein